MTPCNTDGADVARVQAPIHSGAFFFLASTIDYVATDSTGLTATSTRTVLIEAATAATSTFNGNAKSHLRWGASRMGCVTARKVPISKWFKSIEQSGC